MVVLTEEMLTSRAWRFERENGMVISPQLRLLRGGRVGLHSHDNEASWRLRDGALRFHNGAGHATTSFDDVRERDGLRLEGPFRAAPALRHRLVAVPPVERAAGEADAAAPLDRGTGGRPNLVVLRADNASLHRSWTRDIAAEDRNWDLCISWYGRDCTLGTDPDADWEILQPDDRKFTALWKLFGARSPLWRYEYVMFPDDDLRMGWGLLNRVFEMARRHDLLMGQPALTHDSHITHGITAQRLDCTLRFTDFVEVMTPFFSREALVACAPTFGLSRSGFGLDHVWPSLLGKPANRLAILDTVAVTHTRPLGGGYDFAGAVEEGRALTRRLGIGESYTERGLIYR